MPKDMHGVMDEWKHGALHSGSSKGPVVTSRKQAIAIGLSEQRQAGKAPAKKSAKKPAKKPAAKAKATTPPKPSPIHTAMGANRRGY